MSDRQIHAIWRDMLVYLKKHHAPVCRLWFEELEPLTLDGGLLEIKTRNAVQQNYLQHKCLDLFNEAAGHATEALVMVRFVDGVEYEERLKEDRARGQLGGGEQADNGRIAPGGNGKLVPGGNGKVQSSTGGNAGKQDKGFVGYERNNQQPRVIQHEDEEPVVISPDYSFDHFVTGKENQLAAAAAKSVAENPGAGYNPLFIHGGVGLGKTHLLQAICNKRLEAEPYLNICYMSCDAFMNRFYEAVSEGKMLEFRQRYRHVDMLIIDDIHFLTRRERTQEEFFHTFNTLFQVNTPIVLSSDSPPEEIPELEERLISRFKWGLVAQVEKPCFDTRVAILKQKARMRGITITDDILNYVASRIEKNTRELEGAINRMQGIAMMDEHQGVISLEVAYEAVGQPVANQQTNPLTIETIIDAVTGFYNVKLSDLQSKSRSRSISIPRQVCMYLARQKTRYSLEEIGGYFGGRDHTTVMHAIKSVEEKVEGDQQFADQLGSIDDVLGGEAMAG